MDPLWSNGGKPPDDRTSREQRKARIEPFFEDISDDKEPRTTKPELLQLMQDLKDEGNILFKEASHDLAWMHYRNALFVARMLETRFYYEVKKDFISTLFSNRALCSLKTGSFKDALSDCDSAITTQSTNLKAYYRKVQALKALREYKSALEIAKHGFSKQPTVFKELVDELQVLCEGPSKTVTANSIPTPASTQTNKSPVNIQPVKKVSEVSVRDVKPVVRETLDNEWLQDTNALKTEKKRETTIAKKLKKKKGKSNGVKKATQSVRKENNSTDESEQESDSDDLGEDEKFVQQLQSVRLNAKKGPPLKITQPKVKEEEAWAFPHSPDTDIDPVVYGNFKKVGPIGSKTTAVPPTMGLDNFKPSGNPRQRTNSVPRNAPAQKTTKAEVRKPFIDIDWPLKSEFDFQLACPICFKKVGEGIKGFHYEPFRHNCGKTFLLIRLIEKPELNWLKVRPRPESLIHRNANYKICQQFSNYEPCRVSEEKCTFAHHQPEVRLWTLDRDGEFSIENFIQDLRRLGIDTSVGSMMTRPVAVAEPVKGTTIPGMNYQTAKQTSKMAPPLAAPSMPPTPRTRQPLLQSPAPQVKVRARVSQHPFIPPNVHVPPPNFRSPPPVVQPQAPVIPDYSHIPATRPDGDGSHAVKMTNPLALTHDFKIMCKLCLPYSNFPGRYAFQPHQHVCEENLLAMRPRQPMNGPWFRVRERKNHREFPGNYVLCNSVTHHRGDFCVYGEEKCSFAHNLIEQRLWTVEKDGGDFNVTEFIMQNRAMANNRGFSLNEIIVKHGGTFDFICRDCFYGRPPQISVEGRNGFCSGMYRHPWQSSATMVHFGPDGHITVINMRTFLHKTAYFKICKWLKYCKNSFLGTCRFAHSMVERDVWMLERDTGMTRQEIVAEINMLVTGRHSPEAPRADTTRPEPPPSPRQKSPSHLPSVSDCPYNIQIICGTCWKNGTRSQQDGTKDRCTKGHNLWSQIRIFMVQPSSKEIRSLPRKIPVNLNFIVCKYIRDKKKCDYSLGGPCQFAHGDEELQIWKWMCNNKVMTLDELAEMSLRAQLARSKPITHGESVVAVQRAAARVIAPCDLNLNAYYCQYCGKQCNSEKQWDAHCASDGHMFNVNSDKDHQWNHRQPPWGIPSSSYQLCAKHKNHESCRYSHMLEMYNLCNDAHSETELDEWRERFEWRQMKRSMAKSQKVFSYMVQLLEKYEASASGVSVMSEDVEGVTVVSEPSEPLNVYREDKKASLVWTFILRAMSPLQKVALLYNRDRLHFKILTDDGKSHQIAPGDMFENVDGNGMQCYKVDIQFTGGMFGSFSQWVIFDFGSEPVLVRKLSAEVGHQHVHQQVHYLREKLAFDRWTSHNREIVRPENTSEDPFSAELLKKYKEPSSAEQVITQNTIMAELNRNNYFHKMHKLLELEELTRHNMISSYNLCTEVDIVDRIEDKCAIYPRPGELFARVLLSENLTEDTHAGKLIITSVVKVLLAPVGSNTKLVYESNIVREDNFNYNGRGKDYIYLCIQPVGVHGLKLYANMKIELEIQFQMDRLRFCRMHYAIDCLKTTDIVFPDIIKLNPDWNEQHVLNISSKVLNDDQLKAVRHIVANRTGYTPPFIMYGPFGTGKTETLAQAAMVLLKDGRRDTRILICAQSNSAADLYILKHLDPFLKKTGINLNLRRIYVEERRVQTVVPEVKKYCLLSQDSGSFVFPSKEDILEHRIIITTVETSLQLTKLGLQGSFTHIFVDEAAQALECEAIMPLSLATEKTCIVLTGDHIQISPKVYSRECRRLNFHISLLERLYAYYESCQGGIREKTQNPLNIFLSINYRTKMEVLRFISATFYGGPDSLKAMGRIPSVVELTPLVFYAVQGCEKQDVDSTSYYNMAEVDEIVERVEELYTNWPVEWGDKAAHEIEVVAPYFDQVQRIRHRLRSRRNNLGKVNVDTIHNVQGKEFRALFISTCRTRHLLESSHVENILKSSDADGDIGDFGFLSDPKLLNTALTRAKSYVCVVGDPIALCGIGECVQVWRTYLKHCANMKSLYPQNYTYDSIKTQVLDIQMSPLGMRLKEITEMSRNTTSLAKMAADAKKEDNSSSWKDSKPQTEKAPQVQPSQKMTSSRNPSPAASAYPPPAASAYPPPAAPASAYPPPAASAYPPPAAPAYPPPAAPAYPPPAVSAYPPPAASAYPPPQASPMKATGSPPQPLQPLGINGFSPLKKPLPLAPFKVAAAVAEKTVTAVEPDDIMRSLAADGEDGTHLQVDCIKVLVEDGLAVVSYDLKWPEEKKKIKAAGKGIQSYSEAELKQLLMTNPVKLKHCLLHIKSSKDMFAKVIDVTSPIHQIKLGSRMHCGQAFDGDEVVVEILEHQEGDMGIYGQVVGILRRAAHLQSRTFVCRIEDGNTGVMIPLKEEIPPIYNLTNNTHLQFAQKGQVCVYSITPSGRVDLVTLETVNPCDPYSKLFTVRYIKWDDSYYLPFGIVVGVLPHGRSLENGEKILEVEYVVPARYNAETEQEVQTMYGQNYHFSQQTYDARRDLRDKWCFTISSTSEDLENAISIEQITEGIYEVGVHISDISFFVPRSTQVDNEAMKRGVSFYPLNRSPISILPDRLSKDLCSFLPNTDRLSLSIFMTVNASGEITQVQLRKCIINSKSSFTFTEAEVMLHNIASAQTDFFTSCLVVLDQVAQLWRVNRLGNDHLCMNLASTDKITPKAHLLMEELMIMANHEAAKKLLGAYPDSTPLKCHDATNPQQADEWKEKHASDAINTVALTKPFLDGTRTCTCRVACTCIFSYIRQRGIQAQGSFDVEKHLWGALCTAADSGNYELVQQMIVAPEGHPQLAVAQADLKRIQEEPYFRCSSDVEPSQRGHYSLNLTAYTSFTRPLGCYMDVVVQRMLVSLLDGQACPYSPEEIRDLCHGGNESLLRRERFQKANFSLHFADALRKKPLVLSSVVEEVDDSSMALILPVKEVSSDEMDVPMSVLGLSEKPELSESSVEVNVRWQERIYDLSGGDSHTSRSERVKELDPDRLINKIPAFHWQRLLNAIREEDPSKLQTMVSSVRQQVDGFVPDDHFAIDVSSENTRDKKINHFVDFTVKMHPSMIMYIQLGADLTRGLLEPRLQLLSLTPRLDICVEHRTSPVACFSVCPPTLNASQPSYRNTQEYKKSWLSVINMEAAAQAVSSQDSLTIHNVQIEWQAQPNGSRMSYHGKMNLPISFCKEREIKFTGDVSLEDLLHQGNTLLSQAYLQDLLCVRYKELLSPPDSSLPQEVAMVLNSNPVTWVGHCCIQSAEFQAPDSVAFNLELHQSNVGLPDGILHPRGPRVPCTVEWIPRTPSSRWSEYAIRCLDEASDLARSIAIGKKPTNRSNYGDVEALSNLPVTPLSPSNPSQQQAIQTALSEPFTVVQGAAGSGKTDTGARLAYLFSRRNRATPPVRGTRAQVLVCGPNNKSVDIIAGRLMSIEGNCPYIVRVYSERGERNDYPLPQDPVSSKKRKQPEILSDQSIKGISLHELIRQPTNKHCQKIQELDTLFGLYPEDIRDEQLQEYQKLIAEASVVEFQKAEIILTTCSASARPKLKWGTNIQQIIIDDCGMCMEPEAMIPIILFQDAKQAVLIGDHQQLQPVVMATPAKRLGLDTSLLQRYLDKAAVLTIQHRMHDGIANFPSQHFYSGRLQCASTSQINPSPLGFWPGGPDQPIAFCHAVGTENAQSVAMGDGESSWTNEREVHYAVTVATALVNKYHVKECDVVILSQQQAQCLLIQKKLQLKGLRRVTVCTVRSSRGSEWDYVILTTVRSRPTSQIDRHPTSDWIQSNLGTLADPRHVNVALTRARKGLLIIGNKYLLACDSLWSSLLNTYGLKKKIVEADDFLRLMA